MAAETFIWKPIGPAPIVNGDSIWYVTGRIEAAAPDPTNPEILYVAGSNGGIWKTTNSTSSAPNWIPSTDYMPSLNFGGHHPLIVHPSNHNLILGIVRGEGAGLLSSDDSGQTWQLLGNYKFNGASIDSIAVHPTNTELFYISIYDGLPGVFESTDGGSTWNQLTTLPSGPVSDIIVANFDSSTLYAAVVRNTGSSTLNNGIYKSYDAGATWQLMNGLPSGAALSNGWVRLESGLTAGVIYVVVLTVDASNNAIVRRFKTIDGGDTWSELATPSQDYETRSWHVLLGVDPNNDDHIFVNDSYSIYESSDGGKKKSNWSRADVIPSVGQLGFDWVNICFDANGDAIVTADQGVYRYSRKKKWTSLIGNLQVNLFYTITPDRHSDIVYGVGQDDYHAIKFDGSDKWIFIEGSTGEHGRVLVDPGNSNFLYAYNPLDRDNFVRRSLDGGKTWTTIQPSPKWSKNKDYFLAKATQKSFIMDPSNPSRLLLGTKKVYETANATSNNPTWKAISNILSPSRNTQYQYITALAIAPSDSNTIYAATNDGHLWATFNGGQKWQQHDNGLFGVANAPVVGIDINPANSKEGFAITKGLGSNIWKFQIIPYGLYPSFSWHSIWNDISGSFPNTLGMFSILVNWYPLHFPYLPSSIGTPLSYPFLYVGTDRGVYVSSDLGISWEKFGLGLPNTIVYDLAASSDTSLFAGTFGRGAWKITLPGSQGPLNLMDWQWVIFEWLLLKKSLPDPAPNLLSGWQRYFQLLAKSWADKTGGIRTRVAGVDTYLGQKPGEPISGSGESKHMKNKMT